MFNLTTLLPHNLLQTNPCIRHNFLTQVFRKRASQLHYVGPELRYIFWPPLEHFLFQEYPQKEIAWINIRAMRRPLIATLMTVRKPMWHHTKIKRLIQEIKNHVCSVWTGLTQQKPSSLICWDFVSKSREPFRRLQVYGHWRDAAASSPTLNH